ncbi:hypothetical protein [Actinomadura miaoliensis]|uniref:Uncharacterized protein n=1 Tax=Actinomadura miaoliensis TaxID=430685 RepID=A0ABP7X1B9_9ACTN
MATTPHSTPANRIRCDYHLGDFAQQSTASAFETSQICRCVEVLCTAEDDGFHQHVYEVGGPIALAARVIHHLHAWMDEHLATHPQQTAYTLERPGKGSENHTSLESAFTAIGIRDIPIVSCTVDPSEPDPAQILALPLGASYNSLTVTCRSWPREATQTPKFLAAIALDGPEEKRADAIGEALGTPEHVTLTADHDMAFPEHWCQCTTPAADAIRFERWSAAGRIAHGYVCPHITCRRLVQSG